jgi:hypothetical protein
VELSLFLGGGVDSFGPVALEPGAADVHEVYLVVFQGILGPARCGQEK